MLLPIGCAGFAGVLPIALRNSHLSDFAQGLAFGALIGTSIASLALFNCCKKRMCPTLNA